MSLNHLIQKPHLASSVEKERVGSRALSTFIFGGFLTGAVAFVGAVGLQTYHTVNAWSGAVPVRISLGGLRFLSKLEFQLQESSVLAPALEDRLVTSQARPTVVFGTSSVRSGLARVHASRQAHLKARIQSSVSRDTASTQEPLAVLNSTRSSDGALSEELMRLALLRSRTVVKLWLSEPVTLPARRVLQRVVVDHSRTRIRRALASRVPAKAITVKAAIPAAIQAQTSLESTNHSQPANTQENEVPQREVKARVVDLVSTQPMKVESASAHPSVPLQHSGGGQTVVSVASSGAQRETGPMNPSRLTKDPSGYSWITWENSAGERTLYAQANVSVPTPSPAQATELSMARAGNRMSSQGASKSAAAPQFGSVSGWIGSGATVSIRGDRVTIRYYSSKNHEASPELAGEKFFIASGVSAGSAVVQVVSSRDQSILSAAGIPVLAGVTTQVDFRRTRTVRLRGNLWNSESAKAQAQVHAELRAVGYPQAVAITDEQGAFDLGSVSVPLGLPIFLEARTPEGYPHRYSVSSDLEEARLGLFYFSPARVGRWLSQLDGGVHPKSGMIVAAVSSSILRGGKPAIKNLNGDLNSAAETYWLTAGDRVETPTVSAPARQPVAQWLGVEVNSSSVLAGIKSARGRWLMAEWMPVSPGVISVMNHTSTR